VIPEGKKLALNVVIGRKYKERVHRRVKGCHRKNLTPSWAQRLREKGGQKKNAKTAPKACLGLWKLGGMYPGKLSAAGNKYRRIKKQQSQ